MKIYGNLKKKVAVIAFLVVTLVPTAVFATDLRNVLRDGALILGGGAVVRLAADPINDFINTVTLNRGAKVDGFTKVVPIISLGSGTHIGAAQVGGNIKSAVDSTQVVAQLETEFNRVRIKVLIPVDSLNPIQQFRRVQGVGVTAIIDARL